LAGQAGGNNAAHSTDYQLADIWYHKLFMFQNGFDL